MVAIVSTNVLESKIQIPAKVQSRVSRPHLTKTLEDQIVHHKLILLSAPAGYGKTTLMVDWAGISRHRIAWLSLGEVDNDIDRFLRYLLATWENVQPEIAETSVGIFINSQIADVQAVMQTILNAAGQLSGHLVFVLDDIHLITDEAVYDALKFLIHHAPSSLHFVLLGRSDSPLPLARYRAHGQLLEIRENDLHFNPEETMEFIRNSMGVELPDREVEILHSKTKGWIAGLQLIGLALRQRGDKQLDFDELVSGRQRFITDYLAEEVFAHLTEDTQVFLLKTSILDRLCGPLCEAVTGMDGGQAMLEYLEKENLFILPLDTQRDWFRYHPLFADFLRADLERLVPAEIKSLHGRAAQWYLGKDMPEQAFHHALQGEKIEITAQIVERYFPIKLMTGEIRLMKNWLDVIPQTWFHTNSTLSLAHAFFLAFTGAFEGSTQLLDEIDRRLVVEEPDDFRQQKARSSACRCLIACLSNDIKEAETYGDQALSNLPAEDLFFRAGIYHSLGDLYRQNSRWQEARDNYRKVLEYARDHSASFRKAHIYGALADLDLRRGHLREAAANWKQGLAAVQEPESRGRVPLPVIGWLYIRLAEVLYEWNEISDAWEHLSSGLERAELGGDARSLIAGYLMASRLKLTIGQIEMAEEYLEKARPHVERTRYPHWTSRFERLQLELWLAQDRLRAAVLWSDEMLERKSLNQRPESDVAQLAMARVLIVKGDSPAVSRALKLLDGLLEEAVDDGRTAVMIEALVLQSLAYWRRGEHNQALVELGHALRLAEPERYIRLFADLGLPMGRMLQEAYSRNVQTDYVSELLDSFDSTSFEASRPPSLPEPLTRRESEVLELMAAGLTNREIAGELVISPGTVKKHAANIYDKLGVHSRMEAAARARELTILD